MNLVANLVYFTCLILFSVFWTIFVFVRLVIKFAKSPSTFFIVKSRPVAPDVLNKGWNHHFVQLPGINLHYVELGSKDKPLMLFLHGFPEFWYTWRKQMRAFQDNYRVVAVDMRGYGLSDKPCGICNYTLKKLTGDVKELVAALGYESCTLVAHDWGGIVAWNTVLLYPDLADKLIILNCPHPEALNEYLRGGNFKQILKSWYMFFFQCPFLPELYFRSNDFQAFDNMLTNPKMGGCRNSNAFTKEDLEVWKYTFSQPSGLRAPIDYYRALLRRIGVPTFSKECSMVKPPTLVIWGTEDLALETTMGQLSLKYCRQGVIRLVNGASHWVQEDEPELCIKYMKEFL